MSFCATHLPYPATHSFSNLVYDYLNQDERLNGFYSYNIDLEGIKKAIEARKDFPCDRETLTAVLKKQYRQLPFSDKSNAQIESLLSPKTFTVTTAHQPNLCTGYLYFIYKILHAIRLAETLNQAFPENHFVPVYYMGSEDNDIEELGTFYYEGRKYYWPGDGTKGAVGRMKTESLKPLLQSLLQTMGPPGPNLDQLQLLLQEAYLEHDTVASATQFLVHQLFQQYGLVILDPDEAALKTLFVPVMEEELLLENSLPVVANSAARLSEHYKAQAFARPINIFYLNEGIRERIERNGDEWQVLNTGIFWHKTALLAELQEHPERFSPNVILRPLFQETILPDVAFIGGGSELAYWLQLKDLFAQKHVFFPAVFLRQSVLVLTGPAEKLRQQLKFDLQDLFLSQQAQEMAYLRQHEISWDISAEQEAIKAAMLSLQKKATDIAPQMVYSAGAALAKMQQQLKVLEQKMVRAEKTKAAVAMQRIARLRQYVFPQGTLQERKENFIPFYLSFGTDFIESLYQNIDPFQHQFLILQSQNCH